MPPFHAGAVDFRNVVFGYHPGSTPVLKGVSFGVQGVCECGVGVDVDVDVSGYLCVCGRAMPVLEGVSFGAQGAQALGGGAVQRCLPCNGLAPQG